jgi:hypothetical protein
MRTTLTYLGALAIFAALSTVIFGSPLITRGFSAYRLGDTVAGDPQIYIWGLAWYPHALSHGLDPLQTAAVWAPGRLLKSEFHSMPLSYLPEGEKIDVRSQFSCGALRATSGSVHSFLNTPRGLQSRLGEYIPGQLSLPRR